VVIDGHLVVIRLLNQLSFGGYSVVNQRSFSGQSVVA